MTSSIGNLKPRKLRDFPEYVQAADRLVALQIRHSKKRAEVQALSAEHSFRQEGLPRRPFKNAAHPFAAHGMQGLLGPNEHAEHYTAPDRPLINQFALEAAALVVGGAPVETAAPITSMESLTQALRSAIHDQRVLWHAVELQKEILTKLSVKLTKVICLELQPEYYKLVRAMGDALVVLSQAEKAIDSFMDELHAGGVKWTSAVLPGVIRTAVGAPEEPGTVTYRFLAEAAKMGALPAGRRAA